MSFAGSITRLLHEIDQDNHEAIKELVERILPDLRRLVSKAPRKGANDDVTELTNMTIMRLLESLRSHPESLNFESRKKLFAWLKKVAISLRLSELRKLQREKSTPVDQIPSEDLGVQTIDVDDAVARLKKSKSEAGRAVELRIDGYSNGEIAMELKCSVRKVENLLRYGRAKLVEFLEDREPRSTNDEQ